jgi:hypothetical protein
MTTSNTMRRHRDGKFQRLQGAETEARKRQLEIERAAAAQISAQGAGRMTTVQSIQGISAELVNRLGEADLRIITHPFGDPRFYFVYARTPDSGDLTSPIACRTFEQYRRKGWTAVKLMMDAPRELQAHGTKYIEVEALPKPLTIAGEIMSA